MAGGSASTSQLTRRRFSSPPRTRDGCCDETTAVSHRTNKITDPGSPFWKSRFNADPNIIGKPISLSGDTYTIVGVVGEFQFEDFGPSPQVWVPFQLDPYTKDQGTISVRPAA